MGLPCDQLFFNFHIHINKLEDCLACIFFSIGAKMNGKTRNTNNNHYNNTEENTTLLKKAEQK